MKNKRLVILFFAMPFAMLAQTYTFTNAGAEGREGPTQEQIDANYSGTNLDGKVTINTRGIQEWTVPADGNYSIEAYGAQGGADGGLGAKMSGGFSLIEGNSLKILVGQQGGIKSQTGGGGGGTYIVFGSIAQGALLISAGGGGGKDRNNLSHEGHGQVVTTGGIASNSNKYSNEPGNNGQGSYSSSNGAGLGGAGFITNATNSYNSFSFRNGGEGGYRDSNDHAEGGFGGGGVGDNSQGGFYGGGGGGGYSGGEGGARDGGMAGGGGGGSYNSGTDQINTSGVNIGHGKVIITFLGTANEPPVISQGAGPISKVSSEDTQVSWSASELHATDSDTNSAQLSWSLLSSPSNGTAIVDGNGSSPGVLTYQPDANFHGSDSFSVQVSDGDANDSITINLTINPVDDPSVISGDSSGILNEDSSFTGDLNATDLDGLTDGSYFSISSVPTNGVATIDTLNGNWTYTPYINFFGSDNFTIMITDDQGYSSTQLIFLIVNPVDDTTSISGNTNAAISEDSNAIGDLNATDVDGLTDGSYFSVSSDPSIGTASIDVMEGNWTYIPTPNFFGEDSFTITITDDQGNTATQEISVTINSVDDATLISGDTHATINEDSFASGDLNASDIDGLSDGSYFSISTIPSLGSASIDPLTGRWSYSPNPNFFGTDVFTVTITDDLNFTATQEISVTINTVDDPTTITGDTSGLLFLNHSVGGDINATDIDGLNDSSYFSIHSAPTFGSATVDPTSGSWSYNPQTGFLGDDSFVIQITDDQGYTTNQTISLIPQYNVPVAQTDATSLSTDNKPIFSGSILYDGGLPILEVGFYTSSSSQFTTNTKFPVSLANGSSTFTLELNQTELTATIFVRAFARNQNGETLGEIKRLDPAPIVMQWSSHATVLDNGWMQSDWFGTFTHYPQNWIFHSRLGWLYIPDSTTEELWLWAPDHGWLWTGKDVFPHLYKNNTGTWLYLLDQEVKGKNIYDYQSGLFE